jgi:hypothetical protein
MDSILWCGLPTPKVPCSETHRAQGLCFPARTTIRNSKHASNAGNSTQPAVRVTWEARVRDRILVARAPAGRLGTVEQVQRFVWWIDFVHETLQPQSRKPRVLSLRLALLAGRSRFRIALRTSPGSTARRGLQTTSHNSSSADIQPREFSPLLYVEAPVSCRSPAVPLNWACTEVPVRVTSVALCNRCRPVDFRYAPFATDGARRCNM